MNITNPHITARATAARLEADHAGNVATLYCALLVIALAIFFNTL